MNPQRYRNFFVNMSRLDSSCTTQVSVSGITPGPRVTEVIPVQYRPDYFIINDSGRRVDLLEKIKRRPVTPNIYTASGSSSLTLYYPEISGKAFSRVVSQFATTETGSVCELFWTSLNSAHCPGNIYTSNRLPAFET